MQPYYAKLERQFIRVFGKKAVERLHGELVVKTPVVCIGGDQLTGKSSLAKSLASSFQPSVYKSMGTLFRGEAKRLGITLGEMSASADPDVDVRIDYELSRMVAQGEPEPATLLILEGRQPAVMLKYVKASNEERIQPAEKGFSIYLACNVREQAIRFINREIGHEQAALVDAKLSAGPFTHVEDVLVELEATLADMEGILEIVAKLRDVANRDADDSKRYAEVYGDSKFLNYRDMSIYDCLIDTSALSLEEVQQQAELKVKDWLSENSRTPNM
jgi:cytidylate kinase